MMKEFLKKLGKQQEPDDLDTGYDNDYYGGAYTRQPGEKTESADDRFERDLYDRDRGTSDGYDEDPSRFYRDSYAQPMQEPETVTEEIVPVNAGTLYYTPASYRDCREAIVAGLAESHVVVVNMKQLDAPETVRLFDYVMGAVLALDADMTRLNATTLLLAPNGVEVTEDDLRSLFTPKKAPAETEEAEEMDETEDDFIDYGDLPDEDSYM